MSKKNYKFSEQIGYLLRRAYQRHLAIFQATIAGEQITAVQFSTLCALHDGGPQSQGELVITTAIDQATIRGIQERLKARGLIKLSRDGEDGRKVIISLTPAGEALVKRVTPAAFRVTELTFSDLDSAERTALTRFLTRIADIESSS